MNDREPARGTLAVVAIATFTFAIVLRMPSCYESFWLDELHSAWTISETLGDVLRRADLGHQTPFYFVGLWFWKQALGPSEVALRMSSVLALALSCAVLTIGVTKWTRSILAGASAGLVMAIESNSLFFGTELRPYALIILLASITLVCFLRLIRFSSRQQDRRAWIGLIGSILLAVLCQPTALGVLAWLPLTLSILWLASNREQLLRCDTVDLSLGLAAVAIGIVIWSMTLGETWNQRAAWASFATATSARQIWEAWDWLDLLILPIVVSVVITAGVKWRGGKLAVADMLVPSILLAVIAILSTCFYWTVSRADWIPVWHRRYFIAVLPMFACIVGGSVGVTASAVRSAGRSGFVASGVIAIGLLANLGHRQGSITRLTSYPIALVTRGEDWRSAVDWLRLNAREDEAIYLDSGLIEADRPVTSPAQRGYLEYPVHGPYEIGRPVELFNAGPAPDWTAAHSGVGGRVFVLTRRPAFQARRSPLPADAKVLAFHNLSVIVLPGQL